ncbi:MAG TPA: hypothetical protein P5346_02450 [Spirochaetota bacterium]|nr:hypothetical protein [Spirochaetota bacterium]
MKRLKKHSLIVLFILLIPIMSFTACDSGEDDDDKPGLTAVSGSIFLPEGDTLNGGSYSMFFGESSNGDIDGTWISGGSQSYSIELEPQQYDNIDIYIYDSSYDQVYRYSTVSADLIVGKTEITGLNFSVEKLVYHSVSGTIRLPEGDTLDGGSYKISFYGEYDETSYGDWTAGNAQPYSTNLESGDYDYVNVYVYDADDSLIYRYGTESAGLTVGNDDIVGIDFTVEEIDYPDADAYEPDDDHGDAVQITVDAPAQSRTIHSTSDTDWMYFHGAAGSDYTITADGSGDIIFISLYGGGDFDEAIDFGWIGYPISFSCGETGDYYFEITSWDSFVGGYSIQVLEE